MRIISESQIEWRPPYNADEVGFVFCYNGGCYRYVYSEYAS